ncbi:MAG: YdiU family protein [Halioglobus sp.]
MNQQPQLSFDNSYAALPDRFFARQEPTPVSKPGLIRINHALAERLGIDPAWLESEAGIEVLAGNRLPEGASPIAAAYAGHQFGGWNPQLGDGRAVLLGEILTQDNVRYDFQLKGSGPTPWSRGGDGRAPIGPVLREYVLSEAMAVLGVPTTRALGAVTTGDTVIRNDIQPGAVLARVASSHIRIGTFQYFAARSDTEALQVLVDHVIARHYPQAADAQNPCHAMLDCAIRQQAELIAKWQALGFIHGVMNTDNMLLSGETVDYGPCAFMDAFDPDKVFSSIDTGGRYAYRKQPGIAHWNLSNLAQTLLPLLAEEEDTAIALAQASIDAFPDLFLNAHQREMSRKLGLSEPGNGDERLIQDLVTLMADEKTDFTLTFRRLADLAAPGENATGEVSQLFTMPDAFTEWINRWQERLNLDPLSAPERQASMYNANPVFIPRNHLVEEVIRAAVYDNDLAPFHTLVNTLESPFEYRPELAKFAVPATPEQVVTQTFCGT